ncbi:hypothetical protein FHS42_007479 [Streptomyces zagrosensis]|uniref:Uncharacterized protein n=1 Tax=Streptomyces zagrosensis TaxID=1042984 RepID=A0A7W9V3K0_9ACTN|nr:hypothetical protein [Streptomyces zagrosensis]
MTTSSMNCTGILRARAIRHSQYESHVTRIALAARRPSIRLSFKCHMGECRSINDRTAINAALYYCKARAIGFSPQEPMLTTNGCVRAIGSEGGMTIDVQAQCAEFGKILGLDHPVTEEVFKAALADEVYAANLLTCRRDPELLRYLLSRPTARARELTSAELLVRGASALARWTKAGFTVVSKETYQKRLSACGQCPHLQVPPGGRRRLLYALTGAGSSDKTVCGLCGCSVTRKARLTSESCPAPHPNQPNSTRWAESAPAAHT